jgi:TrpR-related protein YerC/YecD
MNSNTLWENPLSAQFSEAVFRMSSQAELQDFLRDVMTEKEILEVSARFEAARLLEQNVPYTEIAKQTKLSSRTIARISDWLQNGTGGYKNALAHHAHIPPARAE